MRTTKKELEYGVKLGFLSEEIRQTAKQFMEDNGYKLTPQGKEVAIFELESLAEVESYPSDLVIAVSLAIQIL